jgi:flagella basal body P-ring formation protein FlgA
MWQRGTVNVTLQGKASGAAELGETIYVRTENGQRLRCVALGPGLVKVLDASGEEVR